MKKSSKLFLLATIWVLDVVFWVFFDINSPVGRYSLSVKILLPIYLTYLIFRKPSEKENGG